jgi:hypothetical protein
LHVVGAPPVDPGARAPHPDDNDHDAAIIDDESDDDHDPGYHDDSAPDVDKRRFIARCRLRR